MKESIHKSVVIDWSPESAPRYGQDYAVIAVDVIRATTTITTAKAMGRRCFPVASIAEAEALASRLPDALWAGELDGEMPRGFEINNSPSELARRTDMHRPLILLSSSGTKLMCNARKCAWVYLASFQNAVYTAQYIANRHSKIAVVGAGSRGEFREEDEMCCVWIAQSLIADGYEPENAATRERVRRWSGAPTIEILRGKSADYLLRSGQASDLAYVLAHVGDLAAVFMLQGEEVTMAVAGDAEPLPHALSAGSAEGGRDSSCCS